MTSIDDVRQMDPDDVEELVADIWDAKGWETWTTKGSREGGTDVVAEKEDTFHQRQVFQVKRNAEDNLVGSPTVDKTHSQIKKRDADTAVVVATTDFTGPAKRAADDLNVKLINGEQFEELLINNDIQVDAPQQNALDFIAADTAMYRLVLVSILFQTLVFLGGLALFDRSIQPLVFFAAWAAPPMSIYKDCDEELSDPDILKLWFWPFLSCFAPLLIPWLYLYVRTDF